MMMSDECDHHDGEASNGAERGRRCGRGARVHLNAHLRSKDESFSTFNYVGERVSSSWSTLNFTRACPPQNRKWIRQFHFHLARNHLSRTNRSQLSSEV
jgi:hypothetical protein